MGRRRAARQARASKAQSARYAELAVALAALLLPMFRKAVSSWPQQQQQQQQVQTEPEACAHHRELAESMCEDCDECRERRERLERERGEGEGGEQQQQQQPQQQGADDASGLGFSAGKMVQVIVATYSLIAGFDRRSKRRSRKRSAVPLIMGGLLKTGYSVYSAAVNAAKV